MSPIITHEDELELAKMEKELVSKLKKLAGVQESLLSSQKKYIDDVENERKRNPKRQNKRNRRKQRS